MADLEPQPGQCRRRSVDVGGLALALANEGGQGWGGWEEHDQTEPTYAELLSDMYTHTHSTVNHNHEDSSPIMVSRDARCRLVKSLKSWNFEPHKLPDEEVLSCTMILFEALWRIEGMEENVGLSLVQVYTFLRHLSKVYRTQNSYHNFQHALDVLQATQAYLRIAGMVPPVYILLNGDERTWRPDKAKKSNSLISCLDNCDIFTLYIAAIGHDVGHPGFTNIFMKNAKAPLSLVYDDKSALEQMHCALLLQVMRCHGLLDRRGSGTNQRKLLLATVLATDMSVHGDFMKQFEGLVRGDTVSLWAKKVLICQALIKCADISNPSRPLEVSQHWASALAAEWASQAILEQYYHLPATVSASSTPLTETRTQIWFINTFALPLLDLIVRAIPQMVPYARRCASNLKVWDARQVQLTSGPPSTAPTPYIFAATSSLQIAEDLRNAFPLTLPVQHFTPQEEHAQLAWHSSIPPSPELAPHPHSERAPVMLPPLTTSFASSSPTESALTSPSDLSSAASLASVPVSGVGVDAIRAAYQASVRKKKSMNMHRNRNSWNAYVEAAGVTGTLAGK